MRTYEVYRNIRKGAMIWGLPISLFAVMMLSILGSLLVIIFSFSLFVIIGLVIWNGALYPILTKMVRKSFPLNFKNLFPKLISNKKANLTHYVNY